MSDAFFAGQISSEQVQESYDENGYIVLQGVFDSKEIEALRVETGRICLGERGDLIGAEEVVSKAQTADDAMREVLAIHFPHKVSELMHSTLTKPAIVDALQAIIGPDIKCMQSMLFVKNAGKPGQAWHQDEYYIPTRDQSLTGVWIALDDARVDNGGLWLHPGSHKHGIIWRTKDHGDPRFDSSQEAYDFPYAREGGVPVEANAGDVVIFHGYGLHRSLNNTRKEGYRRAIVNHVMNARSYLPWNMGVPPTPREDFRDFEMVCGKDPYAWKGKEDILVPFLRPEDPQQAAAVFGKLFESVKDRA